MTTTKNKLAASVRQVKSQPATKPAPATSAPATSAPAKPVPTRQAAKARAVAADPPASGSSLFPSRVWPD